jgi:hypothetical protein
MADTPGKIAFDDFLRISTNSALEVLRRHEQEGGFKVPPKIWVGILIDPWGPFGTGPLGGPGGPGGVGGPVK